MEALKDECAEITAVIVNRASTWKKLDEPILKRLGIKTITLSVRREEGLLQWGATSVIHKICQPLSLIFRNNEHIRSFASSKVHVLYWWNRKRIAGLGTFDLVAGYNAMHYAAWLIARSKNVPFVFDMEDFHPIEKIYHKDRANEIVRRTNTCVNILPEAEFVSFASPMIQQKTEVLLSQHGVRMKAAFTINNTFKAADFPEHPSPEGKLKLVWFSQTVSYGRGLEFVLPVVENHVDEMELTIIGNVDSKFKAEFLGEPKENICMLPAMPQHQLHTEIGKYDVGLALEIFPDPNDNRALCLTNKMFTYLLAGLYILATDTPAQNQFIAEHSEHGEIVKPASKKLEESFVSILKRLSDIRSDRKKRLEASRIFSWENERELLLNKLSGIDK